MRSAARIVLGAALVAASASPLAAQPAGASAAMPVETQAVVSFQFDRVGLAVPRFTLRVREDGTGTYQADVAEGVSSGTSMRVEAAQHIDRTITLTPTTAAKIFKTARGLDHFNIACASKAKNIADTGKKTLTYVGADGRGSCIYNYSENKSVATLTDTFLALAFTLDEGRRLEFLHRYDRLGLDAEMNTLAQEADAGRALELGTIESALTSIASDTALIQRVRLRAAKMLDHAKDK
jgi:hypothetical protein